MNLKGKRIFVSGGAGVIGTYLVNSLISEGATILVGDLKPCPEKWQRSLLYRQGDLNYITKAEIVQFKPEYFFHLAASFERSSETYEFWKDNFHNNIKLSHHLLSILKDSSSLKKIIFASSYLIYDQNLYMFDQPPDKPSIIEEGAPIQPRNLTGMAKLACEKELEFLFSFKSKQYLSVSARIYRSYGKNSRDIISRWIRSLLNNETLDVYGEMGRFDYIYAGDVAEGLIRLAKTYKSYGIVNLGTGRSRSIKDVLLILKKYFPNMKHRTINGQITKVEASEALMEKNYRITGWTPKTELEKAVPEIINFEREKISLIEKVSLGTNVLVTSLSDKVPLIKAVKRSLYKFSGNNSKVIGSDSNGNCIGKYFVHDFWRMPLLKQLKIEDVIKYCKKNNVRFIFPTRDGELPYFSKYRQKLIDNGINIMISDEKSIEICYDKLLFYKYCIKRNLPVIKTSSDINEVKSKLYVVKERFGAGSKSVGLGLTEENSIIWSKEMEDPIFQPLVEGKEASVDVYVNNEGKAMGIIPRWRETVVDGESKITTSFYSDKVNKMVINFVRSIKFRGHLIMQILIDRDNNIKIIECNPRFGGASTLSLKAGLDSFYWFMLESTGGDISSLGFVKSSEYLKQVRFKSDLITS